MVQDYTIGGLAVSALAAVALFFRAVLLKVLEHFIKALDAYQTLVTNHIAHQACVSAQQTIALERLTAAVERLERRLSSNGKGA
jgi:hypothetical protein